MTSHGNDPSSSAASSAPAASTVPQTAETLGPGSSSGTGAAPSSFHSRSIAASSSVADASAASTPPLSQLEPSAAEFSLLWNRYALMRQVVQTCRLIDADVATAEAEVAAAAAKPFPAIALAGSIANVPKPLNSNKNGSATSTSSAVNPKLVGFTAFGTALANAPAASAPSAASSALAPAPSPSVSSRSYSPQISSLFPVQPRFITCWAARQKAVEAELYVATLRRPRNLSAADRAAAVPVATPVAPTDRLLTLKDVFQTHNDALGLPYVPTDLLKIIAGYALRHTQFERKTVSAVTVWRHPPRENQGAAGHPQSQQLAAPPVMIARFDSEQAFRSHVIRTVLEPCRVGDFLVGFDLAGEEAGKQFDSDRSAAAGAGRVLSAGAAASSASSSSSSSSSASSSTASSPPPIASESWTLDDDRARYMSQARTAFSEQFRRAHPLFARLTRGRRAYEAATEWIKLERPSMPLRQIGLQYQIAVPLLEQPLSVPRAQFSVYGIIAVQVDFADD